MADEIQLQEIRYFRVVRPPTLKQYLFRRYVREHMEALKGKDGVVINPKTQRPAPASAIEAGRLLKGKTADQILAEHPEWREDYEREYGTQRG